MKPTAIEGRRATPPEEVVGWKVDSADHEGDAESDRGADRWSS